MTTQFKTLFSVGIVHEFYGGACPDFTFLIPEDCRLALRGARLFAKVVDNRMTVLYEMNAPGTGPIIDANGLRLRFGLHLTNASFPHFTDLPAASRGMTLLYDNLAAPSTLGGPQLVRLSPGILAHLLTGSTRPVDTAAVRHGAALDTDHVGDARPSATFDLRIVEPGRFEVRETFTGGTTHTTPYYLDPGFQRDGTFAIVEVDVASSFYTTAPSFRITFDAKEQPLRYIVVTSNYSTADLAALSVEDTGFVD